VRRSTLDLLASTSTLSYKLYNNTASATTTTTTTTTSTTTVTTATYY